MKRYRVEFEFMYIEPEVSDGKYHKDYVDNNGEGFIKSEAEYIARHIKQSTILDVKWAEVVEMEG